MSPEKIHLGQKVRFCSDHGNNRAESTASVHISTPNSREQCAEKWAVGTCLALNCRWLQLSAVRKEDHEFKPSLGYRGRFKPSLGYRGRFKHSLGCRGRT